MKPLLLQYWFRLLCWLTIVGLTIYITETAANFHRYQFHHQTGHILDTRTGNIVTPIREQH
jgi:hypothetical protein